MVAPRSTRGCEKITIWPTIQTSYFIGPCNLHYLLFSGIEALLCHHPHCFPSQSQTLLGMGTGRPPITAVARWLFRRENTFDFAEGRGGGGRRCFKHFLEYAYFSRLVKIIIRMLQPFLFISFFNLLNFYPVTRFLVTLLLVTRYCVTLFSNTLTRTSFCQDSRSGLIHFPMQHCILSKFRCLR